MGQSLNPPINEGVYLLEQIAPQTLSDFQARFPGLRSELAVGRLGGEFVSSNELNIDRAVVMIAALSKAREKAEAALKQAHPRMGSARNLRLIAQVLTLICNSGVLAALAVGNATATVVSAVLALVSSIGTLLAEHRERLLSSSSNVYEAFEKASSAAYRAMLLGTELELLVKHRNRVEDVELRSKLADANALCQELNTWFRELSQ